MGSGLLDSHVTSQLARTEIMAAVRHIARYDVRVQYDLKRITSSHGYSYCAQCGPNLFNFFSFVITHEILEAGN